MRPHRGEGGFTLIEVMAAFVIIAIITTAGTSLTVRGLRANLEATQLSQAKNLVHEQVEEMRGLPYFVARSTSTAKVDVLDNYYPNTAAPASAPICTADAATWLSNRSAWGGFVPAGAARCPFEPAGTFYRTVLDPAAGGSMTAAVVVATQYLGLATGGGTAAPIVTPVSGYAWDASTGLDTPASGQIAAYVTAVFGPTGGAVRDTTSRTDIADRRVGPPQVSAETNAAAVTVDATLSTGEARRLELGTVAGNGAVTVFTQAAVEAVGGSMQSATGRVDGAALLATSPGGATPPTSYGPGASAGGLAIGETRTTGVAATSTVSDPGFGVPIAVASAAGGAFAVDQIRPGLALDASKPIVALDAGPTPSMPLAGKCPAATPLQRAVGAGWMNTGTGSPRTVDACARSAVSTVELFRTPTAPNGLLQVVASDLVARCEINGATPAAATSGQVTVSWLTPSSTYDSVTLTLNGTAVTGGALPDLSTPVQTGTIGEYIGSWGAFSGAHVSAQTVDGVRTSSARVPAALTLATVPLRNLADGMTPDPESAVKVTIGRALCSATDRRAP